MNKKYTIVEWTQIFGVEIVDNEGFRNVDINTQEVNLEGFLNGICQCALRNIINERFQVLNKLW